MLLDSELNLTLRPMSYPAFYDFYRQAIKNTWTVEEIDFSTDLVDLSMKIKKPEEHLIKRLVAFFATGDCIVANNLVINLYKHLNAPEARMYLSRQLFEEALHVQFYLTLLDSYLQNDAERAEAFAAISNIPSIERKGEFCFKWMSSLQDVPVLQTAEHKRRFLLNLICFAACTEGLFFFGAFAYVYFLRSRGLLHGLASGTNWVFRDESAHMAFAFETINVIRKEEPHLFTKDLEIKITDMLEDAIACEMQFAQDALSYGVIGLTERDMHTYLKFIADKRFVSLGMNPRYKVANPFPFMELQDAQELTNFFERRVAAYQTAVAGTVSLTQEF